MLYSYSLGCGNILNLEQTIDTLAKCGKESPLHIDIMDGHYVPNLSLNLNHVKAIKANYPDFPMDIHLMVENPEDYIDQLCDIGVDYITIHVSSTKFSYLLLNRIKARGVKAGIAINPSEPVEWIEPCLSLADLVLVMCVEPGYYGQPFVPNALGKIRAIDKIRKEHQYNYLIEVDGAIDIEGGKNCQEAGVDMLGLAFFAIFGQEQGIEESYHKFVANFKD